MQSKRLSEISSFSRLTIRRKLRRGKRNYFECICNCGTVKIMRADNVLSGSSKSCGCLSREKASERLKRLHRGEDLKQLC